MKTNYIKPSCVVCSIYGHTLLSGSKTFFEDPVIIPREEEID